MFLERDGQDQREDNEHNQCQPIEKSMLDVRIWALLLCPKEFWRWIRYNTSKNASHNPAQVGPTVSQLENQRYAPLLSAYQVCEGF